MSSSLWYKQVVYSETEKCVKKTFHATPLMKYNQNNHLKQTNND